MSDRKHPVNSCLKLGCAAYDELADEKKALTAENKQYKDRLDALEKENLGLAVIIGNELGPLKAEKKALTEQIATMRRIDSSTRDQGARDYARVKSLTAELDICNLALQAMAMANLQLSNDIKAHAERIAELTAENTRHALENRRLEKAEERMRIALKEQGFNTDPTQNGRDIRE